MSTVPQPVKGSVVLKTLSTPRDLDVGLYLDEDVALYVTQAGVAIVAPDMKTAELISSSLNRTAWNWRNNLVSSHEIGENRTAYAAWLALAADDAPAGGLVDVSRESDEEEAKTAYRAAS